MSELGADRNYIAMSEEQRIQRAVADQRHLDRLPLHLQHEVERRLAERSERWHESEMQRRISESSKRLGGSTPRSGHRFFSKETRPQAD